MSIENKLSTEHGALAQTVPLFKRGTIRHADELTAERFDNQELRNQWFYTADHAMYAVEDGEAFLYLGREEFNPIFGNLEEAARQIVQTGNYRLSREEAAKVRESSSTLRVNLSDLGLKTESSEFSYFEISTEDFGNLNESQRMVAERVYGSGDNFSKHMNMLNKAKIGTTRVYVLNPGYVKEHAKDGEVARACRLYYIVDSSNFDANVRYVDSRVGLRGVRSEKTAEGGALKNDPITDAYRTLLDDPLEAVRKATPKQMEGVANLLALYVSKGRA